MNHRTRSYLLFVLLIGCICYLVSHFVVQLYFVNGSSMEPTYTSGQPVFLQKFGLPDCLDDNDVVVIRHETLGRDIVKRIVALPGDTVQITEGILYVNGVPQPTPDGFSLMEDAGNAAAPLTLAPGEYFVLGDNRNHSIDSRFAEVGSSPPLLSQEKLLPVEHPSGRHHSCQILCMAFLEIFYHVFLAAGSVFQNVSLWYLPLSSQTPRRSARHPAVGHTPPAGLRS